MIKTRPDIEKLLSLTARIVFVLGLIGIMGEFVRSEVYLRPLTWSAWLAYSLFLFLAIALSVNEETRVNLLLASLPVAMCVFIVNAWLEYSYYSAGIGQRILTRLPDSLEIDWRTSREFFDDSRAAGEDIRMSICPSDVLRLRPGEMIALSGLPKTETLLANELGYFATFVSDRYGFNNPDDIYDVPSTDHTVVLLGDSYTQGYAVRSGDDIASRLRARDLHAFSLGCGGNGPLAELAAYEEYGRYLQPDTVVLVYYEGNDLYDLAREWNSSLRLYLDATFSQDLRQRENERLSLLLSVAEAQLALQGTGLVHRLLTLRHVRHQLKIVVSPRRFDTEVAQFRNVIDELRTRLQRDEVSLLVVYLPHGSIMASGRKNDCRAYPVRCKTEILSVLDEFDIRVLDFEEVLGTLDDPFSVFVYRRGDEVLGHLNSVGYETLAAAIEQELSEMEQARISRAAQTR